MATPRKKPEDLLKRGRKSEYNPAINELANRLALLGLKDREMSEVLGISTRTLDYWKTRHPEFLRALNDGRAPADSKVIASLYKRAQGFREKVEKVYIVNGKPKIVKVNEYFPPSDTACIFWSKNRQRELWRDGTKLEHEHTGKDGGPIKTESQATVIVDASKLEPEDREVLRRALKQAKG